MALPPTLSSAPVSGEGRKWSGGKESSKASLSLPSLVSTMEVFFSICEFLDSPPGCLGPLVQLDQS